MQYNEITIGEVPASIVALSQITDSYEVLKADIEQYNAILELYQQLLDHPWDLLGGEYLFYLNSASAEIRKLEASDININSTERNIEDLMIRENRLLEQIRSLTSTSASISAPLDAFNFSEFPVILLSPLISDPLDAVKATISFIEI